MNTQSNTFSITAASVRPTMVQTLLQVDSYKHSHYMQQIPGVSRRYSYGSARGSKIRKIDSVSFFGLQMCIAQYFLEVPTIEEIEEAETICKAHGEPFAKEAFMKVNELGYWPLTITAVKEGTEVPVGNVLYTVESSEPGLEFLEAFVETILLRGVWYGTTVATISKACKKIIYKYLQETCDNPDGEINFRLHDFGARGVSSGESAAIGGLAHLTNFMGTDTMAALVYARRFYGADMAGFSIPASEHSTITPWGLDAAGELAAFNNMIDIFGKPGAIWACVSDSRDIFNAVENVWGDKLKQKLIDSKSTLVIRPDSGDPVSTVIQVLKLAAKQFGTTTNSKGYKVLNTVRIIQGDGVDLDSIESILIAMKLNQFSAENVAFGMGGALLQKCDRDTFSFAQKCSSITINGEDRDVYKDPIGGGKTSLRGRLALVKTEVSRLEHGEYRKRIEYVTMREEEAEADGMKNELELVFKNGEFFRVQTLDEIRSIANASF